MAKLEKVGEEAEIVLILEVLGFPYKYEVWLSMEQNTG